MSGQAQILLKKRSGEVDTPGMVTPRRGDDGVTLIELCVAMLLFGILVAIGTQGLRSTLSRLEARGAHREAVSSLRAVQSKAVAENVAYCVSFAGATTNTWKVYRVPGADRGTLAAGFSCTSGTLVDTYKTPGKTTMTNIAFAQRNGLTTTYLLFYPRGSSSPGTFKVGGGGGTTYTITVDALTSRVVSSGA